MKTYSPFGFIRNAWMVEFTSYTFGEWIESFGGRIEEQEGVLFVVFDNDEDATAFALRFES